MPPTASMAAMADAEAREMMMFKGDRTCVEPRARSLTPSLMLVAQRESASSLIVIGRLGSMRPWSIQDWRRSRFNGTSSSENLNVENQRPKLVAMKCVTFDNGDGWGLRVIKPAGTFHNFEFGLPSVEASGNFSVLLLSLVAST